MCYASLFCVRGCAAREVSLQLRLVPKLPLFFILKSQSDWRLSVLCKLNDNMVTFLLVQQEKHLRAGGCWLFSGE